MLYLAILILLPSMQMAVIGNPEAVQAGTFTTIQQAINNADSGDTIAVPAGIYYEHIVVNKAVSLIGENNATTIIDGNEGGTVVSITADAVSIVGFTIRDSGWGWTRNGIYVQADNCEIRNNYLIHNCHNIRLNYSRSSRVMNNVIDSNGYGIRLLHATNCVAIGNEVSNCIGGIHLELADNCTVSRNHLSHNDQGIRMYSPCTYNTISGNTVVNNTYDGMIDNSMNYNSTFFENIIYHNDFVNNTYPFILRGSGNIWFDDYPSGGNYWTRYNGTDLYSGTDQNETGNDGIGDAPYLVGASNVDKYPLMQPWIAFPVLNVNTSTGYASMQEAIDAPETLDGHTLQVEPGFYHENVRVRKPVRLTGKDRQTTIVDGNGATVMAVETDNVAISGFTFRSGGSGFPPDKHCGVFLNRSLGSTVANCQIAGSRIGIYLYYSTSTQLRHNQVYNNYEDGIWLWFSGNNTLMENDIYGNRYNFGAFGDSFAHFSNAIDLSNRADGKPIAYRINVQNEVIGSDDFNTLYIISGYNVTIRNMRFSKNGHGLFCFNLTRSTIENVVADDNNYGIYLQASSNNTIRNSHCTNDWVGVGLEESALNTVGNTVIKNCEKAESLYEANNNILAGNVLMDSYYGIRAFSSSFNTFTHNSLIGNTVQADLISSYKNAWDNGCEGNYWSSYAGIDLDGDGVGDTELPCEAVDSYPLLSPYVEGDINHDGRVGLLDLVKVTAAYATTPADPEWNPHADIAQPYAKVDLLDITTIVEHYGNKWQQP
jgi:parallel beta-helix repeat protein